VTQHDPLAAMGPALTCALIAQAGNVLLAAVVAAQVPGGYRVRSTVFLVALLWSLAGTVLLLIRTAGAGATCTVRPGRIALWLVSAWVWPILAWSRRPDSQDAAAP